MKNVTQYFLAPAGRLWIPALAATLLLSSIVAADPPNILRVGHPLDPACDFDDIHGAMIAAALDGSSTTEIRLATNMTYYNTATNITDQSVDLIGGFSDCSDGDPGSAQTTLYGYAGAAPPVILVENGTSTRHQVLLKNLVLRESTSSGDGGGAKLSRNVDVVLDNVTVTENSAIRGGGVFIDGGAENINVTFTNNSQVSFNTAMNGGGVFCLNWATVLFEDGAIAFNEATSQGGGVFVAEHCHFTSQAGGVFEGIFSNKASTQGAGVNAGHSDGLLDEGYDIRFDMKNNSLSSALLVANECLGNCFGGGVAGSGASVQMDFINTVINGNSASYGGGVYIAFEAELSMRAVGGCPPDLWCSRLTNNVAALDGGTGRAGALRIDSGAQASVFRTEISGNSADVASAIRVAGLRPSTGTPARLDGEGLLIAENSGADEVIQCEDLGETTLGYVTITDNHDQLGSIKIGEASVNLYSSIVHDDYGNTGSVVFLTEFLSNVSVDLLMAHEIGSGPMGRKYRLDPGFVDPDGDDYRLGPTSLAIDRGDTTVYVPHYSDMEGQVRGYDDTGTTDVHGTFDLGADEYVVPDVFSNGFESGDTDDWSDTVP